MKLRICAITALACAPFLLPHSAKATVLSTWSWSDTSGGIPVAGNVVFSTQQDGVGYDLVIDLTNTATADPTSTAQLLTGLYFDISASPGGLAMKSAVAVNGLLNNPAFPNTPASGTAGTNICAPNGAEQAPDPAAGCTVDGGWEAAYSTPGGMGGGASATQHWGIGTTGQTGIFHGNDVNAFDFAIASAAVGVVNSSGGLNNDYLYTWGLGEFVLSGLTSEDIVIQNVTAAYGTAPEGTPAAQQELPPDSLPEPGTFVALGSGLLMLAVRRLRRK
jgi:hypothetical protein